MDSSLVALSTLVVRMGELTSPWGRQVKQHVGLWKRTNLTKRSVFSKDNGCIHFTGCKISSLFRVSWKKMRVRGHVWLDIRRTRLQRPGLFLQDTYGRLQACSVTEACFMGSTPCTQTLSLSGKWQGSSHRTPGNVFQPEEDAKWVPTHLIHPCHALLVKAVFVN